MEFKHYIVTRFNIDFRHWKTDKAGKEVRTSHWLKSRLILFNRYCYPSIMGQTNKNFQWIVLIEKGTDLEHFPKGPTYLPVNALNWRDVLKQFVAKTKTETEYVITTRLDNDDAFHERTVHEIQDAFDHKFEFLNLYNGFLLHGKKVYKTKHHSNQFLSLVEYSEDPQTVYLDTHGNAKKHGPIRQLTNRRYWIRVVHGRNMIRDNLAASEYVGKIQLRGFNL